MNSSFMRELLFPRVRRFFRQVGPLFVLLVLFTGCSAKAKFDGHLKRADAHFEKGDHERARIEYLNAFQIDRGNAHVSERLGDCFLKIEDPSRAIQFYSHAKTLQPGNAELRTKIAGIYLLAGQHKEAREEAEEILKIAPQNGEALVVLANSCTTSNEVALTSKRLQTIASNSPPTAPLYVALGLLSQRLGETNSAEAAFKRAVQLDPKASRNHLVLGTFYAQYRNTNAAAGSLKAAMENATVQSVERIRYAEFLKNTGRVEEAKTLLLDSVKEEPGFVAAWNNLAEIAFEQNNLDLAAEYTNKSLAEKPNNRDAVVNKARLSIAKRDLDAAAKDLQALLQRFPKDAQVHYQLAVINLAKGNQPAATEGLDKALEINPNFLEAILLRARLAIARGDYNNAITSLSRAVNQYPNTPQPYYLLAAAYSSRGTPEDAVAVYQTLVKKFPNDPAPHQLLGSALARAEKLPQARQAYENALKINPNLVNVVDEIVELDLNAKAFPAAAARINEYLQKYPTNSAFRLMEAKLHFAQGKIPETERSIRQAIELNPTNSTALSFLANFYRTTGNIEKAISEYEGLLKKNAKDASALLNLALLHEAKGDFGKARQHYEALLKITPNNVVALNNLAYLLAQHTTDLDLALEHARKANELAPNEPSTADTYGWLLWKKGEYGRAATLLSQAAERLPQNPEVQFHLGMAHYMNGASAPALNALSIAVKGTNQFVGKEIARSALEILQINPAKAGPAEISKLERFISENPRDVYAQSKLAQVFEAQQQWDKARERYESALKIAPQSALLLGRLAALHSGPLKDPAKAFALARRAWSAGATPELAALIGPIGYKAGDFKWAYSVLSEALRGNQNDPELLFFTGVTAFCLNRTEDARSLLDRAASSKKLSPQLAALAKAGATIAGVRALDISSDQLQAAINTARPIDQNFPPVLVGSALLAERKNDFAAARSQYEAALKQFPGLLIAQRELAILLAEKLPDDSRAQQLGAPLRAEFPEDAELTKALGKVAYRKGDHRDAARLLNSALVARPDDADLLYHLGMAQSHLKDATGKATLERALKLQPNSPLAPEAKKIIASAK